VRAFSTPGHSVPDSQLGVEDMRASLPTTLSSLHGGETDLDAVIIAAIIDMMNVVIQERIAHLKTGMSLRDVNTALIREYSRYVASLTSQDVATVHHAIATWLARSGKDAGATLLQLVVGARVYQSLGIIPTVGIFTREGST